MGKRTCHSREHILDSILTIVRETSIELRPGPNGFPVEGRFCGWGVLRKTRFPRNSSVHCYLNRYTIVLIRARSTVSILRDASRSVKSLVDSWAVRFLEEMDYTMEANNADRFAKEMAKHKSLGSAIKVPSVYRDMTTRYVLVTQWVDGEKASNLEARSPEGRACLATLQVGGGGVVRLCERRS